MSVLVKYIKGHVTYVPGDVRAVSLSEYKELKKLGIVERTEILEEVYKNDVAQRNELTGKNILGVEYLKGKIDVVVPTKKIENVKSISVLKELKKTGEIDFEIITRSFNEEVGGFAKACNDGAGLNKKLGEFILFLNDDVEVGENFFADLLSSFDEGVGIVGAECSKVNFGINGSVMCVRREIFEMCGGFDENYLFMWEDNDICDNFRRRGWDIEISKAVAKHDGKDSMNTGSEFWRKNYYNGKNYYNKKKSNKRIVGSMIVGDENDRYMSRVIIDLFKRDLIDEMVVVCDQSNKETVEELMNLKKYYLIDIKYHDFKLFGKSENVLRERAIDYAISKNPFGIIPIDADEFFDEEVSRDVLIGLLERNVAWDFILAHYWGDENSVRIDGAFAHQKNIRLFRYCPERSKKFFDRNLHCGSAPIYCYQERKDTDFILKHFGYIKKEDVVAKKERQEKFDKKMTLENPDLYKRMMSEGEVIKWNKVNFIKIWKQ